MEETGVKRHQRIDVDQWIFCVSRAKEELHFHKECISFNNQIYENNSVNSTDSKSLQI